MAGWKLYHRGRCWSGRWHARLRGESDKNCGDSSVIRHIRSLGCVALSRLCEYRLCHLLGLSPSRDHNDSYNQTALSSPCSACRQMTTQSSLEAMATPCPQPAVGAGFFWITYDGSV